MDFKLWLSLLDYEHMTREQIAEAAWNAASVVEREACAKAVEARGKAKKNGEWKGNNHAASSFAECIRKRSN